MSIGVKVYEESNGPMRVAIEARRAGLALFSQSDQNTIVRTAIYEAAVAWIAEFLPKRFSKYAFSFLGYHVSEQWSKRKTSLAAKGNIPGPQPTPLVYTGVMRKTMLERAKPDAKATGKNAYAIIKLPYGHAVRPEVTKSIKTIPKHEITKMAAVVAKMLPLLMDSGVSTYYEKGPQRQLTGAVSQRSVGHFTARTVG